MEKELTNIVLQKSYIELSMDERSELMEWCSSEEEYDQLKQVFIEVEAMKKSQTETVRPETKKSLDALFAEKHAQPAMFWNKPVVVLLYPREKSIQRRPLVQIAAAALLLLLAYPILQTSPVNPERILAKIDVKTGSQKELPFSDSEVSVSKKTKEAKTKQPLMASLSVVDDQVVDHQELTNREDVSGMSAAPMFDHPDGIFAGDEVQATFSVPASEQPDMLDLLTASF